MAAAARLAAKFNSYYAEKPGKPSQALAARMGLLTYPFNSAHDDGH